MVLINFNAEVFYKMSLKYIYSKLYRSKLMRYSYVFSIIKGKQSYNSTFVQLRNPLKLGMRLWCIKNHIDSM